MILQKAKITWTAPNEVSESDSRILFSETLTPGSLWNACFSDFMVLAWSEYLQDIEDTPVVGNLEGFVRIRSDVSKDVWNDYMLLENTHLVRSRLAARLSSAEIENIIRDIAHWKLVEKGSWVMLTGVEYVRRQDEGNLTWRTPLRFSFVHQQRVLKTWGMNLDTWFDLFKRRESDEQL